MYNFIIDLGTGLIMSNNGRLEQFIREFKLNIGTRLEPAAHMDILNLSENLTKLNNFIDKRNLALYVKIKRLNKDFINHPKYSFRRK
jgi:hypothetical protein